jgi:hypothetical protein
MVQRILEMVIGGLASILGLRALFAFPPGSFPTGAGVAQLASLNGESLPPLAWLPVFLLLIVALAAITLGALAHGAPNLTRLIRSGPRARLAFIWAGRATLWLATAGLIVLIYLAVFNAGLFFVPSAALAIAASLLALLPDPQPPRRAIA